jgi:predicted O-methyltransferase YrrM
MYSKPKLALKYFQYYLTASNGKGHGTHSPFVFHFITQLLNDKRLYPEYEKVEALRNRLKQDPTILYIEDFGAGSTVSRNNQRSIASIAKYAAKSKKLGQLLFRMVKHYQPTTILELGTSLGITSSYLALANPEAGLITMEGAAAIAAVAKKNFEDLDIRNYKLIEGNFDDTLTTVLQQISSVDFAFIDGNHRQIPTEQYFEYTGARKWKRHGVR